MAYNLLNTFVPIEITFPQVDDNDFDEKYTEVLLNLLNQLKRIGYLTITNAEELGGVLNSQYGSKINKSDFDWVKNRTQDLLK